MFRKRIKYMFASENLKYLCFDFFLALGFCWFILEFLSYFFPDYLSGQAYLFLLSIFLSLAWAIVKSFPPVKYSRESDSANLKIEIKTGNLFEESSNIALGSSDYFDTRYPDIISGQSLKAQLAKKHFGGKCEVLDKAIQESLDRQEINFEIDNNKSFGNNRKYEIGTVAVVPSGQRKIFISAFSSMDSNKVTTVTRDSIWPSLCKLWDAVREHKGLDAISIPVWGAGFGLAPASRTNLIQLIFTSFLISNREKPVAKKLSVIIYEKDFHPREFMKIRELIKTTDF